MDTIQEFEAEHTKNAIPVALADDLLAVVSRMKIGREPSIRLITRNGIGLPEAFGDDELTIASGSGLAADDEGWAIVMCDAANNLRKLADRIDAWRNGKTPREHMIDFGLDDEQDED